MGVELLLANRALATVLICNRAREPVNLDQRVSQATSEFRSEIEPNAQTSKNGSMPLVRGFPLPESKLTP